jgi:hypothetical protein
MRGKLTETTTIQVFFAGAVQLTFPAGTDASKVQKAMSRAYRYMDFSIGPEFTAEFPDVGLMVSDSYEGNDAPDYLDGVEESDDESDPLGVKIGDN